MRLSRKVRRSADVDDSMIPMINMVFLLLVFFMVAGTIRPSAPLAVNPPESRGDRESLAQRVLHVGSDGSLVLDQTPVLPSELQMALRMPSDDPSTDTSRRSAAPAGGVSAIDGDFAEPELSGETAPLAIRADAGMPIESLREIIDQARSAGLNRVELLTTRVVAAEGAGRPPRRSP